MPSLPMGSCKLDIDLLKKLSQARGLEFSGPVPVERYKSESSCFLYDWQSKGFAAGMDYMKRDPSIFFQPENLLHKAQSILTFRCSYFQGKDVPREVFGKGRISRYAWGRDYHKIIKKRLKAIFQQYFQIRDKQRFNYRIFVDSVPLLERSISQLAGSAFIGKSTMLIQPNVGTWTFIAEVLTDICVFDQPSSNRKIKSRCGPCRRCLDSCPTGALIAPGVLDSRKCISWLTIEKKGVHNEWESIAIGDWLFGCDICQNVCPFNHKGIVETKVDEFMPDEEIEMGIPLEDVLSIKREEDFLAKFTGTSLMRAKREGLLRNAACIVANQNYEPARELLEKAALEDESTVVRVQAARSLLRMQET